MIPSLFSLLSETMTLITSKGHSRVPVYSGNPTNIVGLFLVSIAEAIVILSDLLLEVNL